MGKTAKQGQVVVTARGMVVGTGQKRGASAKWWSAILAIIAILAALLVGGAVRWIQMRQSQPRAFVPSAALQKADSIQNTALSGDYTAAQKQLTQELANPRLTTDERVSLLGVQATMYENQKQYQKALDVFRQLDKLQPTEGSAQAIGQVAEQLGDKPAAIAAYKLAIARLDTKSPIADSNKAHYRQLITNLGGQP